MQAGIQDTSRGGPYHNKRFREAALRYNAATPGINVVLSGVSSREELHQNIKALEGPLTCDADYRKSVALKMDGMYDRLCTGCSYCQGCPKEIEISKKSKSKR